MKIMSKANEYYERVKHQDAWGVDVIYPKSVEEIIEISRIEGVLLGLKMCKEMFAQGEITHEEIYENEQHYKDELLTLMGKVGASEL